MKGKIILIIVFSFLIGVWLWYFFGNVKNNSSKNFEDKERCMKYYDKYYNYLKENYAYENETLGVWNSISDYKMFYNQELDTCIASYESLGTIEAEWKRRPIYRYEIVDFLNWEKELFHCHTDTYMDHLDGKKTDGWVRCSNDFQSELKKYKK